MIPQKTSKTTGQLILIQGMKSTEPEIPVLKLLDLWDQYQEYRCSSRKKTTRELLRHQRKHVTKLEDISCLDAIVVRNKLLELTTNHQTKRILIELNAAFNWAIQNNLNQCREKPF